LKNQFKQFFKNVVDYQNFINSNLGGGILFDQ
jgi:hypothetical protein